MKKFWSYAEEGNVLRIDGPISEDTWWGDEVTPKAFRDELGKHPGDITVYINSPGGDVIAGSQVYTMLKEHKGKVTVRIDGLAASAASVIAMAGDTVQMAPTAYMMIHDPWTITWGNAEDLRKMADDLDEIAKGIILAYKLKTGKDEKELDKLMADETWMSAETALELGFIDEILYAEGKAEEKLKEKAKAMLFSPRKQMAAMAMLMGKAPDTPPTPEIKPNPPEAKAAERERLRLLCT